MVLTTSVLLTDYDKKNISLKMDPGRKHFEKQNVNKRMIEVY